MQTDPFMLRSGSPSRDTQRSRDMIKISLSGCGPESWISVYFPQKVKEKMRPTHSCFPQTQAPFPCKSFPYKQLHFIFNCVVINLSYSLQSTISITNFSAFQYVQTGARTKGTRILSYMNHWTPLLKYLR